MTDANPLEAEQARLREGGPAKYRDKLKEEGKLFVRDRLRLFFPGGPEYEDGLHANARQEGLAADGMVTGVGRVWERPVHFMANDYTVKAGSMAEKGVEKYLRVQERALRHRTPILYLVDSSGGRITDQAGFFAQNRGIGKYYYYHALLSGAIPQIAVLYGPCVAGAAYTPIFCDFLVMVRGSSAMCIASPRMVEMVTGEQVTMQQLGGVDVHARESGSCHLIAESEEHAAELAWKLLSYLPDHFEAAPPRWEAREPERAPAELVGLVPADPNEAFDMRELLPCVFDAGSVLELSPEYAPEILTALARLDGQPVGIVANNSQFKAGAIFPESADKAAEFILKCDAFNLPLFYLCDTPGFMVGTQVEKEGVLKRGKKFIYATATATVPKFCVVVRKAYGAGIYAMCGPAYEPECVLGLPTAEVAIMGPEAAINAVHKNRIDAIADPGERARWVAEKREEYRRDIEAHVLADTLVLDHIVPPAMLREELVKRLRAARKKVHDLPRKRHGTVI